MHFQGCTGGSESFIRASHPIVADALLDVINLNYDETLMAPSGFQAEKSLADTMRDQKGEYNVLVEGAVPSKDKGVYCMMRGKTAESILKDVSKDTAAMIAYRRRLEVRTRKGRGRIKLRFELGEYAGEGFWWIAATTTRWCSDWATSSWAMRRRRAHLSAHSRTIPSPRASSASTAARAASSCRSRSS